MLTAHQLVRQHRPSRGSRRRRSIPHFRGTQYMSPHLITYEYDTLMVDACLLCFVFMSNEVSVFSAFSQRQ
jgi:hypothetical protein